jgi:hypothetical protein
MDEMKRLLGREGRVGRCTPAAGREGRALHSRVGGETGVLGTRPQLRDVVKGQPGEGEFRFCQHRVGRHHEVKWSGMCCWCALSH